MGANKFTAAWQGFLSTVIKDLSETQQESVRRVFYAGGSVVLSFFTEGLDNMTEDEACREIDELCKEFASFASEFVQPPPMEH